METYDTNEILRQARAMRAEEMRPAIACFQRTARGTIADDQFGSRQIERQKRLDILLDRNTAGIEKDRPRKRKPFRLDVDALKAAIADQEQLKKKDEANR